MKNGSPIFDSIVTFAVLGAIVLSAVLVGLGL